MENTNHVFPALHEFLVDYLASIVLSSSNMDGLLDDGIGPAAEGLSCPILGGIRDVLKGI